MRHVTAGGFRYQVELILPGQAQGGELVGLASRPARLATAGLAVVVDWSRELERAIYTADPVLVEGLFQFTDGSRVFVAQPDWAILRWALLG